VGVRARSLMTDRFTGSGRTLLWRDALRMAADYVLIGCGPEGFSKAFPAYKTAELGAYAPENADESSHNSYLDAAITFGLPGAILYAAMLICGFRLLFNAYTRTRKPRLKLLTIGLIASLASVCVHNLFIYDQLSTGLYFFCFLAFSQVAWNVARHEEQIAKPEDSTSRVWFWNLVVAGASLVALVALVFVFFEVRSDVAIRNAFAAARGGDVNAVKLEARAAVEGLNPARTYEYFVARAFSDCVASIEDQEDRVSSGASDRDDRKSQAIELAIRHAQVS